MKRSLLLTFVPAIIIVILSSCSIFDTSGGRAKGRGSYNCSEGNIRFDGDGLCYPSCTEGSLAWTDENHVSVGCMSTTPCVTNSDCGPNQICTQSGNCYTPVQSFCLENDDCPLGTLCEVATGTCKECLINSDCPAGQTCDINTGTCINSGGGTGTGDTTAPSISSKVLTLSSSMFPLTIAWTNATDDNSPLLYRVVSCTGQACNLDSSDDGTIIQDWTPSIVSHTVSSGNNGLAYTFNVFVKDPSNNISAYDQVTKPAINLAVFDNTFSTGLIHESASDLNAGIGWLKQKIGLDANMGISSDNIYPLQMLKKQDGSLIVLATTSTDINSAKMAIFKYNSNGTKDTDFNITQFSSFTVFGGSSGGGYISFYPAVNGYTTRGHRIALQNDSKILVGADDGANIYIMRFDATTGALDTSFGSSGVATITNAMLTLSSGESIVGLADIGTATITSSGAKKVIIAAKARVNSGGTLSYRPRIIAIGENGSTSGLILGANLAGGISGLNPEVKVMKIDDSSGTSRIVVAGNLNTSDVFAARFTLGTAISYDPTFGTPVGGGNPNRVGWIGANIANIGGSNSSDKTVDMAIGNSGEVYVSGSINEASNTTSGLFVAKFNSVGDLDNSFGSDGVISTDGGIPIFMPGNYETGTSIDLFLDGLVIAGYSKNGSAHYLVTARFNMNGSLDTSFGNQGFIVQELVNDASYSETGIDVIADKATDKTTVLGKTFGASNNSHMFVVRYKP